MNKLIISALCILSLVALPAASDKLERAVDGVHTATGKTANRLNSFNTKTATHIDNLANNIKVRVERITTPPAEKRGIISSALIGAAGLIRNVGSNAGSFVSSVAKDTVELGKSTGGAVAQAIKSSANRLRGKSSSNVASTKTTTVSPVTEAEAAPSAEAASAPDELAATPAASE